MSVRKTLVDTMTISSVNALRILMQFAALPILSRLLSPHDYGLVALAMPFVFFAMIFADAGISMSLVRTDRSERVVWSTCFWLSCLLGVVLALCMLIAAPIAAYWLDEPELTPLVMTLGIVLILQTISAVPGAAIQQQHRFRAVAIAEIVASLSGLAVAVFAATRGAGAWSLILQQLTLYGLRGTITFVVSGYRPGLHFRLREVGEHLTFTRDMVGVNLANFLSRWFDVLIIGRMLGTVMTGLFSMASQIARLPVMVVAGPLQFVLYARLASVKDKPEQVCALFLFFTRVLAVGIFPAMVMVAAASAPIFHLFLSEKWSLSGEVFMLMALGAALQAVTALCSTVQLVLGRADLRLRTAVEMVVLWLGTLITVLMLGHGLTVVAASFTIVNFLYTPRYVATALKLMQCPSADYWRGIGITGGLSLLFAGIYVVLAPMLPASYWAHLFVAMGLGAVCVATALLVQLRALKALLDRTRSDPQPA